MLFLRPGGVRLGCGLWDGKEGLTVEGPAPMRIARDFGAMVIGMKRHNVIKDGNLKVRSKA